MGYISLESYYETTFSMIQHHKLSLTEIENMLPWERDVYVTMLADFLKEQNKKIQEQKALNG